MNQGAVITRQATQAKLVFSSEHVYPRFSILDPSKTFTLPRQQLANEMCSRAVTTMRRAPT